MSLFLIIACVLLFLAAFGCHVARWPNLHFGWLGMAFWATSIVLPTGLLHFRLGLEWLIVVVLVILVIILLVRPRAP